MMTDIPMMHCIVHDDTESTREKHKVKHDTMC